MASYGASRLARDVGVTSDAVYCWVAGATSPTHEKRLAIVFVSDGAVTSDVIDRHRAELRGT